MITLIFAQDLEGGIGYQNQLPWTLPNDLKFFKAMTWGHTIVMGRKTFESMDCRVLPGRKTWVVTRQENYQDFFPEIEVVSSVSDLVLKAEGRELMVIGGAELFAKVLPFAEKIIRTLINEKFTTDVKVQPLNENDWQLAMTLQGVIDSNNPHAHQFQWWIRKRREIRND